MGSGTKNLRVCNGVACLHILVLGSLVGRVFVIGDRRIVSVGSSAESGLLGSKRWFLAWWLDSWLGEPAALPGWGRRWISCLGLLAGSG